MARGWESKSVEEQQSAGEAGASTPTAPERARVERQRQELTLQRERILSERTSSPVRRNALQAALADFESRLAAL
jgi:hypothetical protein